MFLSGGYSKRRGGIKDLIPPLLSMMKNRRVKPGRFNHLTGEILKIYSIFSDIYILYTKIIK